MYRHRRTCSESDSDSNAEEIGLQDGDNELETSSSDRPKDRNVWSKVLDEEEAVEQVNCITMTTLPKNSQDRKCESYDYCTKQLVNADDYEPVLCTTVEDDEFDLFKCDNPVLEVTDSELYSARLGKRLKCGNGGDKQSCEKETQCNENRKRRRLAVKDRLGNQANIQNKNVCESSRKSIKDRLGKTKIAEERMECSEILKCAEASSVDELTEIICKRLKEPKRHLIRRIIETIGSEKAVALLGMTEDVQAVGGLMTNDGSRKRTSGGIYLTFLKSDKEISKTKIKYIFADENKMLQMKKKQQEKSRRKRKMRFSQNLNTKQKDQKAMESVQPELDFSKSTENGNMVDDDIEPGEIID